MNMLCSNALHYVAVQCSWKCSYQIEDDVFEEGNETDIHLRAAKEVS